MKDTTCVDGTTPVPDQRHPEGTTTRRRDVGFWLLATTALLFGAASSAPSPLYVVYQQRWHFSAPTLTLVFASYALVLLITLLVLGGLSDFVGRRPVIAAGLVLQLIALSIFLTAHDVEALLAARIVQGIATGAALGAVSAGIADLAPAGRSALASAVNTASVTLGLAVGALASGVLVQYEPAPRVLIYALLIVLFGALLLALAVVPESVPRRPGALGSLRPRAGVPAPARRAFRNAVPVVIATWAIGGLMLSLGPSIAVGVFGYTNHLVGGLVVTAVAGVGSVASVISRGREARRTMVQACLVLTLGVALVLAGVATESLAVFFTGLIVTGAGFGAGFVSALGSIAVKADPQERAELFAALFVVSYAAFGGAAVLAGLAVPHFGLRPTTIGFGFVVIALALLAAGAELTTRRPAPIAPARTPAPAATPLPTIR